jgi:adenosylcobyric acid synthase
VINRFRGDIALLESGLKWLEQKTGKPILAVLPYLHDFHLESEDSLSIKNSINPSKDALKIIVPKLPKMSNHTDFDPLLFHPNVDLRFVKDSSKVDGADLIILPGTKSVRDDLAWLKKTGWEKLINRHLRYQGKLIGICGGYQMLGKFIHDPDGLEGSEGTSEGLSFLDLETTLKPQKILRQVTAQLRLDEVIISGYEIHVGLTTGSSLNRPLINLSKGNEGAISEDNLVAGTYLHGLFDHPCACNSLLKWAGLSKANAIDYAVFRDKNIDLMTDTLAQHFNFRLLDDALEKFNHKK